jgi:hypothetical protein
MTDIVWAIHDEIYSRMDDDSVNVFLCGAADNLSESMRSRMNRHLRKNPKFNVVFPEWLFAALLKDPNQDLLSLENDLATNVDVIILPLEGDGAKCELGAFASIKELIPKLIVINEAKYKRKRGFINQGPIRVIQNHNGENVIYFPPSQEEDVAAKLASRLTNLKRTRVTKGIRALFNLYRFVGLVVLVFQPVSKRALEELLLTFDPLIKREYIDPSL